VNRPLHSRLLTALAWLLMAAGLLLSPISVITALMLLAGSHGTANASIGGILLFVFGPSAALLTGFALWRRWRWGWIAAVLVLASVLLLQIAGWWHGPTPQRSYLSDRGTPTTVSAAAAPYSLPVALTCVALLAFLLQPRVRRAFFARRGTPPPAPASPPPPTAAASDPGAAARDWRVGHRGRDQLYYEEWRDGSWQRIDIDGEMLIGDPHHAVYLTTPERWQHYPSWARDRRDEIVARLRSALKPPGYLYQNAPAGAAASPPGRRPAVTVPASQRTAAWLVGGSLVLLFALLAGLVWHGLDSGETWWPATQASARRTVSRLADPLLYWTALMLYSTLGLGALALLGWGFRALRGRAHR
jgi:hypothetical protein